MVAAVWIATEEGMGAGVFCFEVVSESGFLDGFGVANVKLSSGSETEWFGARFEGGGRRKGSVGHAMGEI